MEYLIGEMMIRVITILILGALISGCSSVDKSKFDKLYRSAKAIEGATAVGVSYVKFGELLQNFATEISIVSDAVKDKQSRDLLAIYLEVLDIYKDSETLWEGKNSGAQYDWIPSGEIYVEKDIGVIADKYNLPKRAQITGALFSDPIKFETISGDSIQVLWVLAGKRLEEANSFLINPQFGDSPEKELNQIRQADTQQNQPTANNNDVQPASENNNANPQVVSQSNNDPLAVSGIISGDEPSAVVGGNFFKLGEVVNGYKIIQIGSDFVEFVDKNGHVLQRKIGE